MVYISNNSSSSSSSSSSNSYSNSSLFPSAPFLTSSISSSSLSSTTSSSSTSSSISSSSTSSSTIPEFFSPSDNSHINNISSFQLMDSYMSKSALGLKNLLQQFLSKRPRDEIEDVEEFVYDNQENEYDQEETHNNSSQQQQQQQNNNNNNMDRKKKNKNNLNNLKPAKKVKVNHNKEISFEDIYEASVCKYRDLRNKIPILTDGAHDIDAAINAIAEKNSSSIKNIPNGPLVKRAPPGRGRRKTLSMLNTPLPAYVLQVLHKQRRNHSYNPDRGLTFSRPFRILFIDDSIMTLKLTANRLQNAGFWIETASNGEDALNLITGNNQYDIVLTDLNMPNMSGVEIALALRKYEETKKGSSNRRQFLIGTSSDTDRKASELALSAGMDVFLAKPFTPSDLMLFVTINPLTYYSKNQNEKNSDENIDEDNNNDNEDFSAILPSGVC